jgi:hypothetical protein
MRILSDTPCKLCGIENYSTNWVGAIKERMDQHGICWNCGFWLMHSETHHPTVIDGKLYRPGRATTGNHRGMAGRRFDIEYLESGKRITTFDLWCQGEIPQHFRAIFPNTAKFINGGYAASNSFQGSTEDGPIYSDWDALDEPKTSAKKIDQLVEQDAVDLLKCLPQRSLIDIGNAVNNRLGPAAIAFLIRNLQEAHIIGKEDGAFVTTKQGRELIEIMGGE